jgi:carboxyl-terminal processing protease
MLRHRLSTPVVVALTLGGFMTTVSSPAPAQPADSTFERVATVLATSYFDSSFRATELPRLVDEFRPQARAARGETAEREVIWGMLSRIPASHLGLLSTEGRDRIQKELFGSPYPTLGLQVMRFQGHYFAAMVLAGGPAEASGIRNWDEIEALDGVAVSRSPRLDWRTDDAHLSDERDPPMHALLVGDGERVTLRVARRPGAAHDVTVVARSYASLEAARGSVRLIERDGARVGYLHLWYIHMTGVPGLIESALDGPLAESQSLVLDLRGRGGSAPVVTEVLRLLEEGPERRFAGPIVALVDRQSRSGKEAFAYELRSRRLGRLVGEPTAGAVIPAAFADVGRDAVLMFPPMTLPTYTEHLELKPTPPDVEVAWGGPYSGDRDPIYEAGLDEAARLVREQGPGRVLEKATPAIAARTVAPSALPAPPSLDALIGLMTQAQGGAEALRRHSRLVATGTARVVDTPLSGTYRVEASAPMSFESTMALGGGLLVVQHVDSEQVWVTAPGGPPRQAVEGTDAVPLRWLSLFYGPLQIREVFPEAAVDGVETFDDRPCVRLRLGAGEGAPLVLIDTGTWLARGFRYRAQSSLGVLESTTYLRSYRTVDGVPVADWTVIDVGAQKTEFKLDDIELR